MRQTDVELSTAQSLHEAERRRVAVEPVRDLITDVDGAYRVQDHVRRMWEDRGRRKVGYKIGATSRAVREQFGLTEPDRGVIWADAVHADGGEVAVDGLVAPRIETEIAFVMDRDLSSDRPTVVDLIRATAFILPAMEIADCRIRNCDVTAIDSVCDNASFGGAVVGCTPVRPADVDLRELPAVLAVDDVEVAAGRGRAAMGNPWVALAWLAGALAEAGTPLCAGDLVLTGALLHSQPLVRGSLVRSTFALLGTVEIAAV